MFSEIPTGPRSLLEEIIENLADITVRLSDLERKSQQDDLTADELAEIVDEKLSLLRSEDGLKQKLANVYKLNYFPNVN